MFRSENHSRGLANFKDVLHCLACCCTGNSLENQKLRQSSSGIGRFSHGHTNSAASSADWGSGNYSPTSAGQPLHLLHAELCILSFAFCTLVEWLGRFQHQVARGVCAQRWLAFIDVSHRRVHHQPQSLQPLTAFRTSFASSQVKLGALVH